MKIKLVWNLKLTYQILSSLHFTTEKKEAQRRDLLPSHTHVSPGGPRLKRSDSKSKAISAKLSASLLITWVNSGPAAIYWGTFRHLFHPVLNRSKDRDLWSLHRYRGWPRDDLLKIIQPGKNENWVESSDLINLIDMDRGLVLKQPRRQEYAQND